jgi:gamma-glutamylcyclotransferase (GGCT)/AIG2-like uncharacterized protein YtfP
VSAPPPPLFAYGTLAYVEVQDALFGRRPRWRGARVKGWRVGQIAERPYPIALPDPKGTLKGKLLWLTEDELSLLEAFEDPHPYERATIELTDSSGKPLRALSYLPRRGVSLAPRRWRRSRFEAGIEAYLEDCRHFAAAQAGAALGRRAASAALIDPHAV